MYKRLLVPLDGSEFSECSLNHARAISTGCHVSELVLMQVVEPIPQVYELGEDWRRDAQARTQASAKDYLSKVADDLKGDLTKEGVAVVTTIESGKAAEVILDYVDKNRVDLIAMTTHGRSGVSRWVMGSVADRIVHHSPVPVLLTSPPGCRSDATRG